MTVTVRIPTPLRKITGGSDEVKIEGSNIAEVLTALEAAHPGIKERICEEDGKLRKFVNLYVNDEDIRFKDNMETSLKEGDELSIVPAIAGGQLRCGKV
ncbi:FIG038648: MoaD and/or ThiS families [hydrothermal vent metagenome]|uniref:FIG038648: MoaD and/or ThiS families n=1 Tax=hydrothermal vent metagenome TaxID=652676 RepID=A0A3B0R8Z0_9ZZZZ